MKLTHNCANHLKCVVIRQFFSPGKVEYEIGSSKDADVEHNIMKVRLYSNLESSCKCYYDWIR